MSSISLNDESIAPIIQFYISIEYSYMMLFKNQYKKYVWVNFSSK